ATRLAARVVRVEAAHARRASVRRVAGRRRPGAGHGVEAVPPSGLHPNQGSVEVRDCVRWAQSVRSPVAARRGLRVLRDRALVGCFLKSVATTPSYDTAGSPAPGSGRGHRSTKSPRDHGRLDRVMERIVKAVFPVAGLGTRFLPVTKAAPKEILPIVDKPIIQYAA